MDCIAYKLIGRFQSIWSLRCGHYTQEETIMKHDLFIFFLKYKYTLHNPDTLRIVELLKARREERTIKEKMLTRTP